MLTCQCPASAANGDPIFVLLGCLVGHLITTSFPHNAETEFANLYTHPLLKRSKNHAGPFILLLTFPSTQHTWMVHQPQMLGAVKPQVGQ